MLYNNIYIRYLSTLKLYTSLYCEGKIVLNSLVKKTIQTFIYENLLSKYNS